MKCRLYSFFILITFLFTFKTFGQVSQEEFDAFKKQVNLSLSETEGLKNELNQIYREKYLEIHEIMNYALEHSEKLDLEATFTNILLAIGNAQSEMIAMNNISSSSSLGFDFKEQLIEIATNILVGSISNTTNSVMEQKKKNNFKNVIKAIVDNSVVQSLIKSNPITSTAYTIINQAFSTTNTEVKSLASNGETDVLIKTNYSAPEKFSNFRRQYSSFKSSWNGLGGSYKGYTESERAILDDAIQNFTKKIQPYINIYDSLNVINEDFRFALNQLEASNKENMEIAENYLKKYANSYKKDGELTELNLQEAKNRAKNILDTTKRDFRQIYYDKLVLKPLTVAREFQTTQIRLRNTTLEYLTIQISFIERYISILDNTMYSVNNGIINLKVENIKNTKSRLNSIKSTLEKNKATLESK